MARFHRSSRDRVLQTPKMTAAAASRSLRDGAVSFDADLHELRINGVMVKSFDVRATNQLLILSAFQEQAWKARIDDPLRPKEGTDNKARLRATIHSLNGCQHPSLIRFFADGSGQGIRWELVQGKM